MKKFLSIILCLSMLMSLVPVSVFAAPVKVPDAQTADEAALAEDNANGILSDEEGFTVTYHSGTGATVSNMPSQAIAKGVYTVTSQKPEREGYQFAGWTLQPGADETVTQFTVTSNTNLFAKWVLKGLAFEFENSSEKKISAGSGYTLTYDYENGVMHAVTKANDPLMSIDGSAASPLFYGGDYNRVLIKLKALEDYTNAGYVVRFEAVDRPGGTQVVNQSDKADEKVVIYKAFTANEWVVLDFDFSKLPKWTNNYIKKIRIDMPDGTNGKVYKYDIDSIAVTGAESLEYFKLSATEPVTSAEKYGKDDVTTLSNKYKIKDVEWIGNFVDGKYFDDNTKYKVKVTLVPEDGYVVSASPALATVNNKTATVTTDTELGRVYVEYEFDYTDPLSDFTMQVATKGGVPAEISTPGEEGGTLQLEANIEGVDNKEVYWSISEEQSKYATVDENGLVTANIDCDALIVTATSKYDPEVKKTISIKITGQIPEKDVDFHMGLGGTEKQQKVTNMPAATKAKGFYRLPVSGPVRTDYSFIGWSKEVGGEIIETDNVTENTTYYANWGFSKGEEFDSATSVFVADSASVASSSVASGVLTLVPSNANTQTGVGLNTYSDKPEATTAIFDGDIDSGLYDFIEVKTNIAPEETEVTVGVQSVVSGTAAPVSSTEKVTFYSNTAAIASNPDYNLYDTVLSTKDEEYYIYRFPVTLLKNWKGTISHVSFNFAKREEDVATGGYIKFDEASQLKFEHIRFVGHDIPRIDFINVSVPETKGIATTFETLELKQQGQINITSVKWSGASLIEDQYFDGGKTYKLEIIFKANDDYAPLSRYLYCVTLNGEVITSKYNALQKIHTVTKEFTATEDLGPLTLITVTHIDNGGETSQKMFAGDVYDATAVAPTSIPDGYKFLGWSYEENGEIITEAEVLTENTNIYAVYEFVESIDFSKETDRIGNFEAQNSQLSFTDSWAVITPNSSTAASALAIQKLSLNATEYDYVEIIYDGNMEEAGAENKFGEDFKPVLIVKNGDDEYKAVVSKVEPVITNYTVSYKYIYDLTKIEEAGQDENGNDVINLVDAPRHDKITELVLAPYTGSPAWAVASIKFIKNADIEEQLVVSGISAPKTWGNLDFVASANGNYEIKNIEWLSDAGFNADGSFKADTSYTVSVTVKPKTGYRIIRDDALIVVDNNEVEAESAEFNTNGTITVKYTYPATSPLVKFALEVEDAEIAANGEEIMTLQLVPNFVLENEEEKVPFKTVKWEIIDNGPDGRSAELSEDGLLTAIYNAPEGIKVRATSDYDPNISTEATIIITGLTEFYNITFDKNTKADVENMPETDKAKREYLLPHDVIPTREGFTFAGWTTNPKNTNTITKSYITEDTTFYAIWVSGFSVEFFDDTKFTGISGHMKYTYDTENGVFSYEVTGNDAYAYIGGASAKTPLFFGGDYQHVRVRLKVDATKSIPYKIYFTSRDADGKDVYTSINSSNGSPNVSWWDDADRRLYFYKTIPAGEYTVLDFDFSGYPKWTENYITGIRLDIPDSGGYNGLKVDIDYIRAANDEVVDFEVTGLDTPVAKKQADFDAQTSDNRYTVTKVEWEQELFDNNFFYGDTAYTANIYVKGNAGYVASDVPSSITVNGNPVEDFEYDYSTNELIIKYTFPETASVTDMDAYKVSLVAKNTDGTYADSVDRMIFKGDKFDTTAQKPATAPDGERFIGWATDADAVEPNVEIITVNGNITLYAVYEKFTGFDFSNPYHMVGHTATQATLSFKDNLVIVSSTSGTADSALITPAMNIDGSDVAYVEVYYSADYETVHEKHIYPNRFGATREPQLKFSTMDAPTTYLTGAELISAERVVLDGYSAFYKYTYDMSNAAGWNNRIASLYADPYEKYTETWRGGYATQAYPDWGVRYIKLIYADALDYAAEIELEAPETMAKPASAQEVSINDNYKVTNIAWSPVVNGEFGPYTSYAVSVTYKADSGYKLSSTGATINGEDAEVVDNGDGTFTASYTFEETSDYKDVTVTISAINGVKPTEEQAENGIDLLIKSAGRYADLKAAVVADDGSELPTTDVVWSIANQDETDFAYASISVNGRVYPKANGVVVVKAQSVYNSECYDEFVIDVTGQAELYTVTFDLNTFETVDRNDVPESVTANGDFVPEEYTPVRDGFYFIGWSTDEDALEPDKSFKVTKDVTLYGKWAKGVGFTFDDQSTAPTPYSGNTATFKDGVGYYKGTNAIVFQNDSLPRVETSKYNIIQMRFAISNTTGLTYYLGSTDGVNSSPWNESARIDNYGIGANGGEFQTLTVNLSNFAAWNKYPYIWRVRLNMSSGIANGIAIDWLRILTSERYVKYDANGGRIPLYDGEVYSFKENRNTGIISLPDDPVREGYVFLGWAKDPENYTKLYNNKFPLSDNAMLYAIWVPEDEYVPGENIQNTDEEAPKFIEVGVKQGFGEDVAADPTYPTLSGNEGVTSHATNTTVSPTEKPKPTPPANTNSGGSGSGSGAATTTPAEPAKPAVVFAESKTFKADQFKDVKSSDWFYKDVEKTFKLGLMNGKSDTDFVPNGTLTIAEAITVAARMNATYYNKTIANAAAGEQWYTPYVKYATDNKIISAGQFADYTATATRAIVAQLFVNALPASWYAPINFFTSVPDVPSSDAANKAVLMLYNAGIITGVDDAYNFKPASDIKRSELSAIINRVADKDSRQRKVLDKAYEDKVITLTAGKLVEEAVLSGCSPNKLSLKDDYASTTGTGDPIVMLTKFVSGMKAEDIGSIEVGIKIDPANKGKYGATVYFTTNGAKVAESLSFKTTYKNVSGDGYATLVFDTSTNAEWKGAIDMLRFDPFNAKDSFGISYIRILPKK